MGWVLDLDGVIWLGDQPIPGAAEAVASLQDRTEVLFVTNNSAYPLGHYEEALQRHGIDGRGRVVSSALAAAALVEPGERVLLCAGAGAAEALVERGAEIVRDGTADVVVVGFHRDFDYERMRVACAALRGGARLIATNDDVTYPTPEGPIPGGGAILASIVAGSGRAPTVAGKPYKPIADLVRSRVGPVGMVVGDRPDTDGRFAVALGYQFGLVLSGVTSRDDLPVEPTPDMIADDLVSLVSHAGDKVL